MTDLHSRLQAIAGPGAPPMLDTVDADLARGRRALRRRRSAQLVTGSAVAVAAVLTAALALPATVLDRPGGTAGTGTNTSSGMITQLVAYTGEQPNGFTLDRVPDGWQVQGQDEWTVTLARPDASDTNVNSCIGKICIWLQEFVPTDVASSQVEVAGRPGILATMRDTVEAGTLFVEVAPDRYLTVQFWEGLNWTEAEIVEFAAGIHVHDDAKVTHG